MTAPLLQLGQSLAGAGDQRRRNRRRLLWLLAAPVAVLVTVMMVLVAAVGTGAIGPTSGFGSLRVDPNSATPITVTDSRLSGLSQEQLHNAARIIATGMALSAPPRAWVIALATASQESNLRNIDYGDRDSLGLFQQRPSQGWGTPSQVMDPTYATTQFLRRLLALPGWQAMPLTVAAQEVQRSAFPNAYARWEGRATALVEDLVQALPATGPVNSTLVATALNFAHQQLGKPYVWGATGPSSFDCSGLTLRSWEAAGVMLPRTSREQWKAGRYLPVTQAQAGDLLFWAYDTGDPTTIHHVAIYLGNGTIIEAQQAGVPVHVRPVSFTEAGLMRYAVRVSATY